MSALLVSGIAFGEALAGMFIRLPIVRRFLQLLSDASGGHPRRLASRPPHRRTPGRAFWS